MPKPKRPTGPSQLESAATAIRVLVSEPRALVSAGLLALLERIPEVALATGAESQQILTTIKDLAPHIVLLDVPVTGPAGLALLKDIVAKFPIVRPIVVTEHANQELAVQVLRLGAAGVITKNAPSNELERAEGYGANGSVIVKESDRVATGARVTYFAKDETYHMTGTPVDVVEIKRPDDCKKSIGAVLYSSGRWTRST